MAWAKAIGAGDPAAVEQILEGIVADRERGRDPIGTLRARYYLALNTAYSGHRVRAVELYTQLVANQQRLLGPDRRDTLQARHKPLCLKFIALIADQLRVLGPDHPDVRMTSHCLANWVGESGDPRRAAEGTGWLPA